MKKTRLIALFSALLLTLSACGGSGSTDDTTVGDSTEPTTTDDGFDPILLPSGLDFKEYEFRILTRGVSEFHIEEDSGTVMDAAIINRERAVEELLNVEITTIKTTQGGDANAEAIDTILAGDDAYDLISTHGRSAFQYAASGCNTDLNKVENLHLEARWWNQDMRENFEIAGKLYAIGGSISIDNLSRTHALFFSHDILDDYNLEYPYQLVKDDEWTLDKFEEYVKKIGKDLSGDGEIKGGEDLVGYVTCGWTGCVSRLYTTGTKVVSLDNEGMPKLTLYNEKALDLYDRLFKLLDSPNADLDLDAKYVMNDFSSAKIGFYDGSVGHLTRRGDVEMNFGILPFPKYDESIDRYYQLVDGGTSLVLMPITVGDTARSGAIFEALAYYGEKYLFPAYYDTQLTNRYVRDEESIEMLDIIRQSQTYDLAYFNSAQFGGALANPGRTIAADRTKTLTTVYESNKSAVEGLIAESMEDYLKD